MEKKIFHYIKEKTPPNNSFIDVISDVLELSYDASYRRVNGKTTLSFEEASKLIKFFRIPLSDIYASEDDTNIKVVKKANKGSVLGLEEYLKDFIVNIGEFTKLGNSKFTYVAKDFPIYHSFETDLLRKFKLFAFAHVLSDDKGESQKTKFEDFEATNKLNDTAIKLVKSLKKITNNQIWDENILNTTLFQIKHLQELNLMTSKSAELICNDLIHNVNLIEKRATKGYVGATGIEFNLYYNKMINLNNSIFLTSDSSKKLMIPYTTLSFLSIDDKNTIEEIENYYEKQLQYSKKISGDAGMERKLFFLSLYEKIEQVKKQILLQESIRNIL